MQHKEDNKRIAKNSLYLYIRSLIIMLVSLYTSRVVLNTLGFVDHGLYNLIGSVVVMFNMFSATFVSSTQRFLNFSLGKKDQEQGCKVFSASLNIHFILAAVLLVLMESIGLWFLNNKLNIPGDRVFAANVVYQFSILTFLINLISIPYNAVIIANEKMNIFAIVSVYEAVAKLAVVFLIQIASFDRLIFYSFLLAMVSLSIRFFYGFYCKRQFPSYKYNSRINDNKLYREILFVSGWNFLGSSATIVSVTGIGIIINLFTNVVVNSAKGIAGQVENVVKQLVDNFMISIRPQITKSYAGRDMEYLKSLISRGTRFSFILMSILCIPIIVDADNILTMWLSNKPEYTTQFVQFTLIYIMLIPFSNILDTVLLATGKIKVPQIILSAVQLLNLPFSCLILYLGFSPYLIYVSYILVSYISFSVRLHYVIKYTSISLSFYIKSIVLPVLKFISCAIVVPIVISYAVKLNGILRLLCIGLVTELSVCFFCWLFILEKNEHQLVLSLLKKIIGRK